MRRAVSAGALVLVFGCGTGSPPYAECSYNHDCPEPSEACYHIGFTRSDGSEGEGSFCSLACSADVDCPEDGACIALAEDPESNFFCTKPCRVSTDCYAGFACTMVDGGGATMQICLP